MLNYNLYEQLKDLNIGIYHGKTAPGWKSLDYYSDGIGTYCEVYTDGIHHVMVIQGTEGSGDIKADSILIRKRPGQSYRCENYYRRISKEYPNLIISGHSLGGSCAQIISSIYGCTAICFAPFDTGHLGFHGNNIINFGSECDIIYTLLLEQQPGKVFLLPYNASPKPIIIDGKIKINGFAHKLQNKVSSQHILENWEPLKNAVEYI